MNAYGTSAEEFHSLAIALLRVQQTEQWLLDTEKSRKLKPGSSHITTASHRFRTAGIAIVILAGLFCSSRSLGQSTFGGIRGTVQDGSGAAIPDAQVTLHSVDENTDQVTKTDATGSFTMENVKAGKYSLRGQRTGFADA